MLDDEESVRLLGLSGEMRKDAASNLNKVDDLCTKKHLAAINGNVVTHQGLDTLTCMEGENVEIELELAGLENAPGLYNEVTHGCRLAFTDKKRLIFTQARHSAEIGMPSMYGPLSLMTCFHDRWSRRKWSSYYATLKTSEIVQVFVQQTLVTSYEESSCTFNDVLSAVCCPIGGTIHSEKNIHGATQTLGDYDTEGLFSNHDYTRYMRHALVIRYLDCASNQVLQTVAFAHPETPAAKLFEMAGKIDMNIEMTATKLLENKILPTVLRPQAFHNTPPAPPLYARSSYRAVIFIFFVIACIFFAISTTSASLMLLGIFVALGGSYAGGNSKRSLSPKTESWLPALLAAAAPKVAVFGATGVGFVLYVAAAWTGFTMWQAQQQAEELASGFTLT